MEENKEGEPSGLSYRNHPPAVVLFGIVENIFY
jgi:hypothetical protein